MSVWWITETHTKTACTKKWQNNQPVDCDHNINMEEEEENTKSGHFMSRSTQCSTKRLPV